MINIKQLHILVDHSLLKKSYPGVFYTDLMKAVDKKVSLKNFKKNKPLMKFIVKQNYTASMNENEVKRFYAGVYGCHLFKKD